MSKLGLNPETPSEKLLKLSTYLPSLPPLPATLPDWSAKMPTTWAPWGALGNNSLGCCTISALGHIIQQITSANDALIQPSETGIIESYCEATGYKRGDKTTDRGFNMQGALSYIRNKGLITSCASKTTTNPDGTKTTVYSPYSRHKIRAYVTVDLKNVQAIRAAYWLLGTVYLATTIPNKIKNDKGVITNSSSSFWDVAPVDGGPKGGHAISIAWINDVGPVIMTWGRKVQMTWNFWDKYGYGAYGILSTYWANQDLLAPSGFNLAALDADLAALAK